MRKATIFYDAIIVGILTETNDGDFTFEYTKEYINKFPDQFITFSMPVCDKVYRDNRLFPFFEGLIPEGWLLDIATKSWKINQHDKMGLLLACCKNCIGAVSVEPLILDNE
jgi:serine/threonine-protein kinase HipA